MLQFFYALILINEFLFMGRDWALSVPHLVDTPQTRYIDGDSASMNFTRLSNAWASRCPRGALPEQNLLDFQWNSQLFAPAQNLVISEVLDRSMGMQRVIMGTLQQKQLWVFCSPMARHKLPLRLVRASMDCREGYKSVALTPALSCWAPSQACDTSQLPQETKSCCWVYLAGNSWLVKEYKFALDLFLNCGKISSNFSVYALNYGGILANK